MPSKQPNLVQICLPTHNGEAHLAEALDSLLAQTHGNIQIILMDNASTDRTAEIAQNYARMDSRIQYYRSEEFVSASANWNRALDKIDPCRAEYFMWASDDDLWSERYIEHLLVPLKNDKSLILSYSQFDQIDGLANRIDDLGYRSIYPTGGKFNQVRNLIITGQYSAIYGIIRLSALTWSPPMIDLSFGSDLWFLIQLAAAGQFHLIKQPLFHKRSGGISERNDDSSASSDPRVVWNLGEDEWAAIDRLDLNRLTKLYIFNRLRVSAKLLHPGKRIPWVLLPWFAALALGSNLRWFGIRSRIGRRVHKFV